VLISILTDVDNDTKSEKGKFDDKEKENFYNSFHQALIIPILENSPNDLDLSTNKDFKTEENMLTTKIKLIKIYPFFLKMYKNYFLKLKILTGI
jgi:hypothetical protein